MKYHFNNIEEAIRVLKLGENIPKNFKNFTPHTVILVRQTPFANIIGTPLPRLGVLSSDGNSILYGGIMYKYGVDKNNVGFLGDIIATENELNKVLDLTSHTILVNRYLVDGE